MPCKIPFRVTHISGQDDNYRGVDLNTHSPTTKGWHSARFCIYPQDVVVQLERRARIRKIQILSHQYLIATKIEFFIGDVQLSAYNNVAGLSGARFTRLGYVALSNNEKTGFRARELKSVHVDAIGCFVKFIIHKNHVNKHNVFNQVGLVALNIIGDELVSDSVQENEGQAKRKAQRESSSVIERSDYISPLDDLAFDMYQDPDVAQVIRKLEQKKQEAVASERYDLAKKIKLTIEQLQLVGEKLGKAEVEKRQAIENEDYDKAKLKKQQMDEYRLMAYNKLRVNNLLESSMALVPVAAASVEPVVDGVIPGNLHAVHEPLDIINGDEDVSFSTDTAAASPAATQRYVAYDDRPIPTARRITTADDEHIDATQVSPTAAVDVDELTEKDQREAAPIIEAFDITLASKMYSKHWSVREDALLTIHQTMLAFGESSSRDAAILLLHGAIVAINRAVKDNVLAVFNAALSLHHMIMSEYVIKHRISRIESTSFMEKTFPNLLLKIGDTSSRHREAVKVLIIKESHLPEVNATGILIQECLRPFKLMTAPRLALSRTELVGQLFEEHGFIDGGLTVTNMMLFLTEGALRHSSGEVRDKAERLIVNMYQVAGAPVRDYLLNTDEKTRKSLLYKQLFKAFERIDASLHQTVELPDKHSGVINSKQQTEFTDKIKSHNNNKTLNKVRNEITNSDTERVCIFCGEHNEIFTEEGLDIHYWKNCPVLRRCQYCRQVIEISGLTDHLLQECETHFEFKQCPRCTEAIHKKQFLQHKQQNSCISAQAGKSRCPLCHQNIEATESSWRQHLMSAEVGCQNNPRNKQQRQQQGPATKLSHQAIVKASKSTTNKPTSNS